MEELTRQQAIRLLERSEVGHLGVISNHEPYVTPISYVFVDGVVAFRTGPGRRVDAIRQNPRVTVVVSDYDGRTGAWQSAIVFGAAHAVSDADLRERFETALHAKYEKVLSSPIGFDTFLDSGGAEGVLISVHVDEISGRWSGGRLGPRTRPGRL